MGKDHRVGAFVYFGLMSSLKMFYLFLLMYLMTFFEKLEYIEIHVCINERQEMVKKGLMKAEH